MRFSNYFFIFNILIFSVLIISCSDTDRVNNNNCNPTCKDYQVCNESNKCELKKGYCNTENDCSNNQICNSNNKCIDETVTQCTKSEECASYEECKDNKCILKQGSCNDNLDCPKTQTCENNHCTEKTDSCDNTPCREWETCNTIANKCELITGKCLIDSDCEQEFTCNSQGYCQKDDFFYTTIQNLQTDESLIDKKAQTIGIVTAIALSQQRQPKGLYIQFGEEKHSGLYVYFIEAGATDIKVGDRIKVTGILDRDIGHLRIRTKISDIQLIRNGEMPYKPISVDYFTALDNYESMLIDVILNSRFNLRDIRPEHWIFINQFDSNLKIYVKDTISYLNHLSLSVKLNSLIGILDNFNGLARVLPRTEDDIVVYVPFCEEDCKEWEECLDIDYCAISEGRCVENSDCRNENATCNTESHYCEEPSILDNADIDNWTSGKPNGYLIGDALKVTQEDNKVEASSFSAKVERFEYLKTDNDSVEFLSPPVAVEYDKNYELSLFILDTNYDIDAKIYYKAYDVYNTYIGSGIAGDNDFTKNIDNWVQLKYVTGFIDKGEIWRGLPENLSYIRFGIRLYKGHCDVDSCPDNYEADGTGYLYVDSLNITEK